MKYKLIRLPEYDIIVNTTKYEEGIHPEVKYFDDKVDGNNIFKSSRMGTEEIIYSYVEGINENRRSVYEIIAGIGALPSIDYNGFDLELGNIEGLASEYEKENGGAFSVGIKDAFIEGARKEKSLNDKKFSLEELFIFAGDYRKYRINCNESNVVNPQNAKIYYENPFNVKGRNITKQSILEPKKYDIYVQEKAIKLGEERIGVTPSHEPTYIGIYDYEPKITNNKMKITKLL